METSTHIIALLAAFFRIASFLFFLPMLTSRYIPSMTKITVSLALAWGVVGTIVDDVASLGIVNVPQFSLLILTQIAIGLTLSYLVSLVFTAVRIAGGLLDMDMGFSASQIIDPSSGQHVTVLSNLLFLLFSILFLKMGGINTLIAGLLYSFKVMDPGFFLGDASFFEFLMRIVLYMFTAAIQIAIPLTASMFVINFMMLIVGKSAPQMNVFQNIFIIKISAGLLLLYVTVPYLGDMFLQINDVMFEQYMEAIDVMFKKR